MNVEEQSERYDAPVTLSGAMDAIAKEMKKLVAAVRYAEKGQLPANKALPALEQARAAAVKAATLEKRIAEAIKNLADGQEKGWLELEARLKELCERHGWRIDGSWPSFIVDYGVQVNIDERAKVVQVGTSKVMGANMEALEAELSRRVTSLVPRDFAPERFLEDLFAAYQDARRTVAQVPIQEIYRQLVVRAQRNDFWKNAQKDRYVEITIEQFRARLCRALAGNVVRTKGGGELRLYPPLDSKEGLFMYSPVDRRLGFVGRLEFVAGA